MEVEPLVWRRRNSEENGLDVKSVKTIVRWQEKELKNIRQKEALPKPYFVMKLKLEDFWTYDKEI
jgi:hypothetical protein